MFLKKSILILGGSLNFLTSAAVILQYKKVREGKKSLTEAFQQVWKLKKKYEIYSTLQGCI